MDVGNTADADNRQEFTLAANWFFHGHLNKLTAEISHLDYELDGVVRDGTRFRLQWDVSF